MNNLESLQEKLPMADSVMLATLSRAATVLERNSESSWRGESDEKSYVQMQ